MCGFFITNNISVGKADESRIENKLRFRGPDCSSGLLEHGGWKAYHARLSIIDPETGTNQPMYDRLGGMLVFNGEILNFKELGIKHFNKKFTSDTKLLSELIVSNKLELSELDGFFAFVYIDKFGELKHAVRDPFGVKPLFFYRDNDSISFCSEPALLKDLFGSDVNEDSIEEYYATRAPIFSGSYFNNIYSVEPGSCYINGKYFDCLDYIEKEYEHISVEEIKSSLLKGLETRLVSDVPVALLLSRGVDSNLLRKLGETKFQNFYSIGFEGDEDIEYIKKEKIKKIKTITCTPDEYKAAFDYLIELRGEPMSVPNEVLLYLISKKAANDGIKVLLSGEGADEFFAGYDRIFKWAQNQEKFDLDEFLSKYCYIPPQKNSKLYNKFEALFEELELNSVFEMVRWFFIRYHMPVLFRRLDFSLMAAGVEGREPIANMHTFVKAVKISPENLMGNELGKVPLREVLSSYMGRGFAYEKKVGFPVDLTKIFENENNLSSYELWFKENLKVLQ
ncbi:TPA: asparagine synthase [Vibrio parahaemolyticus]|nr:asparagine synthase [Vibrio parahaemolyticus]